jgi:hypothetical protein
MLRPAARATLRRDLGRRRNGIFGWGVEEQRDMTEKLIKVRFELDQSDWHGHGSETLWASPIDETERRTFRIMNSPFFAKGISNRDIVKASAFDNDFILDFKEIVERGGHSTYMLLSKATETRVGSYWNMLEKSGCSYESMRINLSIGQRLLFSVDVPPSANIYEIYGILQRGESASVWMFQEGYAYLNNAELR